VQITSREIKVAGVFPEGMNGPKKSANLHYDNEAGFLLQVRGEKPRKYEKISYANGTWVIDVHEGKRRFVVMVGTNEVVEFMRRVIQRRGVDAWGAIAIYS
jgi:hypothetical protein